MITLYRSTAVKSKNWRRPYSPQNPSEKLLLICCYLLLTRYRCPKNPFYLSVCGGRRVNVFRSSHGYHVTGLSTFESARTYTYREIQSRKKYCIYHIWVFISSCFNNHFINNFPFRLVQKFWEMVISCSYAYIPSPYLHLTSHMLPAKVMFTCVGNRFLIIYFWPHCLFPGKCLNYLIIDQKYSVVSPYHATFNLTFLNKKNTKHFYINGKTYVLYVLGSHLLAHLSLAMANL